MTRDLFILALDHRGSIERMHGVTPPPTREERRRIRRGKQLVFDALVTASHDLGGSATAGVLVDEQYGGHLVEQARDAQIPLAVCAEQSGRAVVDFEYPDWQRHIDALAPDYVKVLTRYHPHGDADDNLVQRERLRALGAFLAATPDTKYLLEIIVEPSEADLDRVGGDHGRFVAELRADLIVEAVEQLQHDGVEPDLWKVEGLESTADCRRVSEACRQDGRTDVGVVVLGAGASTDVVDRWLRAAAATDGYRGFAVGRTIWADALRDHLAGATTADELRAAVAARYAGFVDAYQRAAT